MDRLRILTNVEEPRVAVKWRELTTFRRDLLEGKGILADLRAALTLLRHGREYDAIVLECSRRSNLFAMLAGALPCRKPPVVMIDCLWSRPRSRRDLLSKRVLFRLVTRVVSKFVVWTTREIEDYSAEFGLPKSKFYHIPFHHTLEGFEYEVSDGDYIFSGGDGHRDYVTLVEAVRGLPHKLVIATRCTDWQAGRSLPSNVEARPTSPKDFRNLMAGSRLVVVAMGAGHLHVGGEQTYLNAMALGKPVIVTDDRGAPDYIQHGVSGLIVPPTDAVALREAIESVIENPQFAITLANNARSAYKEYSTTVCMQRILELVYSVAGRDGGTRQTP